jgi:alkylation response protein AidB-like acyl-CoA dehydrogenase
MDFRLTEEQEEAKRNFEAYFREAMKDAPPQYLRGGAEAAFETDEGFAFYRRMAKKLGEKGWLSMAWPKQYGGQEASIMDQIIFNETRDASNCPGYDIWGSGMFAPTLLVSGTEEQKQRLLPPIAKGEVMYCQGWSEPDAGSDLANLSTMAIKDGDEYVINGQKTWTSAAHRADHMFILVRTDPDSIHSKGLSVFSLDMNTPGIDVRPLYMMNGARLYNDVYFKNVRVPAEDLIGGEGNGWAVTQNTMNFERSGIVFFCLSENAFNKIVDYIKKTKRNGRYLSENPIIRQKVARLYSDLEAGKMMAYRVGCMQEKGGLIMAASVASESKVFGSELYKKVFSFGTEVMGMYGMVAESEWSHMGDMVDLHQVATGVTIGMGTNEVQRSIIAWMGLKMPRYRLQK